MLDELSDSQLLKDVDFNQLNPVDGTHFGRPWCQRHGSGRMYHVTRYTSSLKGPYPQALTLFGGLGSSPGA